MPTKARAVSAVPDPADQDPPEVVDAVPVDQADEEPAAQEPAPPDYPISAESERLVRIEAQVFEIRQDQAIIRQAAVTLSAALLGIAMLAALSGRRTTA